MFVRRAVLAVLAAGAVGAAVSLPSAVADPTPTPTPAPGPAAEPDCSAAGLSATISSVTKNLSDYFAAHPDANQALIDATRQSAFGAIGAFKSYFDDHPDQADEVRAIKAPLADYQNRCGLQVEPAEALVVIGEL